MIDIQDGRLPFSGLRVVWAVGEGNRVDCLNVEAKYLQGKHRRFVAHVAMDNVALQAENAAEHVKSQGKSEIPHRILIS